MLNCPNCGAALNPYQLRCEYCGTAVVDLGTFNLDSPCYVRFKSHDYEGKEFVVLALVQTSNASFEMNTDIVEVHDIHGNVVNRVCGNHTMDIHLDLNCLLDSERKEFATIVYQ